MIALIKRKRHLYVKQSPFSFLIYFLFFFHFSFFFDGQVLQLLLLLLLLLLSLYGCRSYASYETAMVLVLF